MSIRTLSAYVPTDIISPRYASKDYYFINSTTWNTLRGSGMSMESTGEKTSDCSRWSIDIALILVSTDTSTKFASFDITVVRNTPRVL